MSSPTVVILDDDPTGTQAVADVAVITLATPEELAWAFATSPRGFFILTNSRSLDEATMTQLIRSIVGEVLHAAQGRPVRFISRSDSTLRGHLVSEVTAIHDAIASTGTVGPPTTLFVPAFPHAGRVTRRGVHLLREDGLEIPAHESHYAKDPTFGYATSDLTDLIVERSSGSISRSDVAVVAMGAAARVSIENLVVSGSHRWVVCDAEEEEDLAAIVQAVEHADPTGERVIIRSSPGILPSLLHLPPSSETSRSGSGAVTGGLIIVGSHVAQTTRQLARLMEEPDIVVINLEVNQLVDTDPEQRAAIAERIAVQAAHLLRSSHVAIATTRTVRQWTDPLQNLIFARRVSDMLVDITHRVADRSSLAFVVAKGGITSSDIATRALGIRRAMIRGRVGAGIVWEPLDGVALGVPFALVPGNIGDDDGLVQAVRGISYQRSAGE